jgi:hypothetical protein
MAAARDAEEQSPPKTSGELRERRREFAEAWSRKYLLKIGLTLLRSGIKPGQPGEPAYRIISTSRLTLAEVCNFTVDQCNGDFSSLDRLGTGGR